MPKIRNLNKLMLTVVVLALSSTAVAVASEGGAGTGPEARLPHAQGLRHGPVGVRPSTPAALKAKAKRLHELKAEAKHEKAKKAKADAASSGPVDGVSQSTLDAIASCESGGDPTAVNAGGYYGKYQFDTGTWSSVGGSGNPAQASEGEQDYRASLLYERAGSSPWPVCGQ